jgi:hypothetical protein
MFKKLFNRAKVTLVTPAAPEPLPAAPLPVAPKENRLEAFREEWVDQWETSHEVIEGQGGHTDWAAWTDAVEKEEKFFAPTVPMPLDPQVEDSKPSDPASAV